MKKKQFIEIVENVKNSLEINGINLAPIELAQDQSIGDKADRIRHTLYILGKDVDILLEEIKAL